MACNLAIGSRVCECTGCGECFSAVSTFDMHRTGPAHRRRCLSAAEMQKAGMEKGKRGHWVANGGADEEATEE